MDKLFYGPALLLVVALQKLPLLWVAWLGRRCGAAAYWIDFRHRRVAENNLARAFPEKEPREIRALARENFRRLGENFCSAVKTAAMGWAELSRYVEFTHIDRLPPPPMGEGRSGSCIVAIGHFGNFEIYARFVELKLGYVCATTYRGLRQPSLNRLLQRLRSRSGCLYFERRTDAEALKAALSERKLLLGLLADQHAGQRGVSAPFFGQACSTSPAPALLALRYGCPLHTGICYRVGLGRWRIEAGPAIPTHEGGHPRTLEAITCDINRALEVAVRRDPANWFWVHKRWKPFRSRTPDAAPAQPARSEPGLPVA